MQKAGTYQHPDDDKAERQLQYFFRESASTRVDENVELDVNGRIIRAFRCAKGIAWFRFAELCEGPRSQADYIELARCHQTVFMSNIPVMGASRDDRTRRFIFLVDEFYDRRVKLVMSAEAPLQNLYIGERLAFEFRRTVSRLTEMQTSAFLGRPHLG